MPPLNASLDAALCPLCGHSNQCAMVAEKTTGTAQPPCWCTALKMDASLLAPIPEASRGLACICSSCATRFQSLPPT